MFKNYFYLNRLVIELNNLLNGITIREIFSQEKDTLYFFIPSGEFPSRHLVISVNPHNPFVLIKNEHYRAKKNTLEFFEDYIPSKIERFYIAPNDRIIKISLYNGNIFIVYRGSRSNIFFINPDDRISFKKDQNPDEIISELQKCNFIDYPNIPDFQNIVNLNNWKKELKSFYPQVSKEIISLLEIKEFENLPVLVNELKRILTSIFHQNIKCSFDEKKNEFIFCPENLGSFLSVENSFDNYNEALLHYIIIKDKHGNIAELKKIIENHLDKEMHFLAEKLNKLQERIESGCKDELYKQYADILLSNIHNLTKGLKEITLYDFYSSKNILIKLDEKLTPDKNVERYYEKSRDEKINYQKSYEIYNSSKNRYNELIEIKNRFYEIDEIKELNKLKEKLKLNTRETKKMDSPKFKHYIIDSKYDVYVGRDSKNNDYLSTKFAKQNDYWFHVRGLPGSHVVLRVINTKEVVPKNIIKDAASLAAYHSKAKTAGLVPVIYTFAKFVYKKKGMDPGQVMVLKENVILVKPEIPSSCEFIEE